MPTHIDLPLLAQQLRATGDSVALGLAHTCDQHHTEGLTLDPGLLDTMSTFITPAACSITTTTDNDNHIDDNSNDNTSIHINDDSDDGNSIHSDDNSDDDTSVHYPNTFPNDEQMEAISRSMPHHLMGRPPKPTPLEVAVTNKARAISTTKLARRLLSQPNGIPPKHRTSTSMPYLQRLKRTTRWLQAQQARRISLARRHRTKRGHSQPEQALPQSTATRIPTSNAPSTLAPAPATTNPHSPPTTAQPTATYTHTNTSTSISPAQPLQFTPNFYEAHANTTTPSNSTRHTQGQLTTATNYNHTHSIERADNTPDPTPPPAPDLHQLSQLLHRTNNHVLAQSCEHAIDQGEALDSYLHQTMLSKIAEFFAYQTTFGK